MNHLACTCSVLALLTPLALGCSPAGKGAESNPLAEIGSKADSFFNPTDLGQLQFFHGNAGGFAEDRQFLAYQFELTADSVLELEVQADDGETDTVMYLYRQRANGDWGSYVAKDDDGGFDLLSKIDASFGPGQYKLIVKAFEHGTVAPFYVEASCTGSGCPAITPAACDDTVEAWLRECAEEQQIETEFEMSFPAAVEMCTDTPFAGLGDEPDEVFSDLCDFDHPAAICPAGIFFFLDEAVPACVTMVVDEYNELSTGCPLALENNLVDCAEELEAGDGVTFEEGLETCSEFTSEIHEELCAHDDPPDWCVVPFDVFVDQLLAQCLHDFLS